MPQAPDTKEQILDAAEALFSANGVEGVSLRALTKEANVNLASVHYHFGSKEAVVRALFVRRSGPVNQERIALLDELEREADGAPLAVESILTALFLPVIRITQDPERQQVYRRLIARFYFEPAEYLESLFEQEFAEVIRRFEQAFSRALPSLPLGELCWRMHFTAGVMVHTMLDSGRTHKWAPQAITDASDQETLDAMVRFVAGGMRTAATAAGAPPGCAAPAEEVVGQ